MCPDGGDFLVWDRWEFSPLVRKGDKTNSPDDVQKADAGAVDQGNGRPLYSSWCELSGRAVFPSTHWARTAGIPLAEETFSHILETLCACLVWIAVERFKQPYYAICQCLAPLRSPGRAARAAFAFSATCGSLNVNWGTGNFITIRIHCGLQTLPANAAATTTSPPRSWASLYASCEMDDQAIRLAAEHIFCAVIGCTLPSVKITECGGGVARGVGAIRVRLLRYCYEWIKDNMRQIAPVCWVATSRRNTPALLCMTTLIVNLTLMFLILLSGPYPVFTF